MFFLVPLCVFTSFQQYHMVLLYLSLICLLMDIELGCVQLQPITRVDKCKLNLWKQALGHTFPRIFGHEAAGYEHLIFNFNLISADVCWICWRKLEWIEENCVQFEARISRIPCA